ncbi:MAG: hypothetical protein U0V56_01575 [Actinomycetota bacterium]
MIDSVLQDGAKFAATEVAIPPKHRGSVGRSRTYPDYLYLLWPELRAIFGSNTAVERELGRGGWWRYIRGEMARLYPDLPLLPAQPPRRQHYEYMRNRYLEEDGALRRVLVRHTEFAVSQAKEASNLTADAGGSPSHPAMERTLYGDGTVIKAIYKSSNGRRVNKSTGEIRMVRHDPDAKGFTEGGGNPVHGIKVAAVSTRRAEGRFILGLEHVTGGDEAGVAVALIRRVVEHAPAAEAVVYDMALRGTHHNELMTQLGLVPVVKVHAKKEGPDGRHAGDFEPKTIDLDDVRVALPDGREVTARIAAVNGWLCVKSIKEDGEPHFEPLPYVRIQRRRNHKGFRFYAQVRLPAEYGGKEATVRLHENEDDVRRGIPRAENVRAIPEGSADFKRLHVLRNDAESINRGIDDSFFLRRASAKGWRRVMIDLLAYARVVNAVTAARVRASGSKAAAA